MLSGDLGVDALIRGAKQAHIQAAILELFPPKTRVNISRLSVITGLTRKEISALIKNVNGKRSRSVSRIKQQRALRVLRGWRIDPRFHDRKGQPAELALRGGERTFSLLVKLYGGDVTPTSVLKELERMKAIRSTRSGKLRMRYRGVRSSHQATLHMSELARLFGDFANTVTQAHAEEKPPVFFGFRDSTVAFPDEAGRFQRTFSNRAAALLESFDQWLASHTQGAGGSDDGVEQTRVGIGVYLVQDKAPQPVHAKHHPVTKTRRSTRSR